MGVNMSWTFTHPNMFFKAAGNFVKYTDIKIKPVGDYDFFIYFPKIVRVIKSFIFNYLFYFPVASVNDYKCPRLFFARRFVKLGTKPDFSFPRDFWCTRRWFFIIWRPIRPSWDFFFRNFLSNTDNSLHIRVYRADVNIYPKFIESVTESVGEMTRMYLWSTGWSFQTHYWVNRWGF